MKVKEYIELLQQFPQDLEVMHQSGEFCHYYTPDPPKLQQLALYYSDILKKRYWEDKESVIALRSEILEEKTIVEI